MRRLFEHVNRKLIKVNVSSKINTFKLADYEGMIPRLLKRLGKYLRIDTS